jgi:hypothetical protein
MMTMACEGSLLDSEEDEADATESFADCDTLTVEYDLSGSQFEIRDTPLGAGDATNEIGPGRLRIQFAYDGEKRLEGAVKLVEYSNAMQFVVSNVETNMLATSGPDDCGVADGEYQGNRIEWATPVRDYHSRGDVTCNAGEIVCGLANLPDGEPAPRDTTTDQPLEDFQFEDDGSFAMDWVEIPNEDSGNTFLSLEGRETIRVCGSQPDCAN